jgi:cation:H+ antiporter
MHIGDVQDRVTHKRSDSAPTPNGLAVQIAFGVLGALVLVALASDAFTNAVEWVGKIFGLTRSAAGAIVAAIGSSLPETMVAFVALIVLRDPASQAIGVGAVLGAPFMLATIVFCLIGVIAIVRSRHRRGALHVRFDVTAFGLLLFCLTFALVIGASFAPTLGVRIGASAFVVVMYVIYILYHVRVSRQESDEAPPRLRCAPHIDSPPFWLVSVQLLAALAVTVLAARWFVSSVSVAAVSLRLTPLIVSLFLSPIATELPEILNVWLWMRQRKDDLAVGNVLGAMMFQTSMASALAMLATPWRLGASAYAACAAAMAAALFVLLWSVVRRRIEAWPFALCGLLYLAYTLYVGARSATM